MTTLDKLSEEELHELIRFGSVPESQEALGFLMEKYEDDVWRFANSKLRSPIDADDVVMETWMVSVQIGN